MNEIDALIIDSDLQRCTTLTWYEKAVVQLLRVLAEDGNWLATEDYEIAQILGMNVRSVARLVPNLVKSGWLISRNVTLTDESDGYGTTRYKRRELRPVPTVAVGTTAVSTFYASKSANRERADVARAREAAIAKLGTVEDAISLVCRGTETPAAIVTTAYNAACDAVRTANIDACTSPDDRHIKLLQAACGATSAVYTEHRRALREQNPETDTAGDNV